MRKCMKKVSKAPRPKSLSPKNKDDVSATMESTSFTDVTSDLMSDMTNFTGISTTEYKIEKKSSFRFCK